MGERIPIRFDRAYRALSTAVLMPPDASYIHIDDDDVEVRMGWGFRARFPRAAVEGATPHDRRPWSRGVHGFNGRWLVNGSGAGIVRIDLEPRQRAFVCGVPVRLRQLLVSVDDPASTADALT